MYQLHRDNAEFVHLKKAIARSVPRADNLGRGKRRNRITQSIVIWVR